MLGFPRRRCARHPSHDYAGPGVWLLTISTWAALPLFGEVVAARVRLNSLGGIVDECWTHVPDHFPNARMDDFVVMPNHVHALLELSGSSVAPEAQRIERFGAPVPGSIATVVRSFKSATTRLLRQHLGESVVVWQPGFHDRRIHDNDAMRAAREYIADNPARWSESHPRRDAIVGAVTYKLVAVAVRQDRR